MGTRFFLSECGGYLCRYIGDGGQFEAWTRYGSRHWRHDNRIHPATYEKEAVTA